MKNTFITEQEIHERLKQGRTVRMSSETRTRIQAELSAYADMHSVPTALDRKSTRLNSSH